MAQEMFEQLIRGKVRFASPQGQFSIEDLYDLPLESKAANRANLLTIARGLLKEVKESEPEDFGIGTTTDNASQLALLKLEAVRYVINVRLAEQKANAESQATKAQLQQILGLIAQKENEAMAGKPIDELRALVALLQAKL